jgi:hypothetical protein
MAASPSQIRRGAGPPRPDQPREAAGWTAGRIVAVVAGSILALVSLALLAAGVTVTWADHSQRQDGYLTSATATYSASGYALASDTVALHGWRGWLASFAGPVRIRVTAADPGKPVFVAIAPAPAGRNYLSGVAYTSVPLSGDRGATTAHPGAAVPQPPLRAGIWAAQAAGPGTQALVWTARDGDWMAVAMNQDGSARVSVQADIGAQFPALAALALELLVTGILLAVPALALIVVPVRMAAGSPTVR